MATSQGYGRPTARRYSSEEKAAAVRMVRTLRAELGTEHGAVQRVATQLGFGVESVRMWVKQADVDDGHVGGVTATSRRCATANGYYKTELVRGPARLGPWKAVEDLGLATLGWVHWHNTQRLHGYLGDVPLAEFEQTFYAGQTTSSQRVGIK